MDERVEYNGWNEWAKYVLKSIERLECNLNRVEVKNNTDKEQLFVEISKVTREVGSIREELSSLNTSFKIKSGIWGALSGILAVISLYLMQMFGKLLVD